MRVSTKRKTTADDVRRVALAALATALDDSKEEAKKKPGLTGVRAVATGAVLYTAGRAVFTGRRFVRNHFGSDGGAEARDDADDDYDDEDYDDDEPRAEDDDDYEDEEPRAEDDEDFDDEDYDDEPRAEDDDEDEDLDDEPRAEEDEDYDDEPRGEEDEDYDDAPRAEDDDEDYDDEPRAEEDEDYEDEEPEEEDERPARRTASSRRPPSHAKRRSGDAPQAELPSRPSRSRAPVGLS